MNAIVRHNYPVSQLPDDLRKELAADVETVLIQITVEHAPKEPRVRLSDLVGKGANVHGSEQEVLDWLREGREDRGP